jgi:putative tryptophan/tyrosine transport system substrate-binding protein
VKRREFITLLGGAGLLLASKARRAQAQQSAMPVVGYLGVGSVQDPPFMSHFRQGLAEAGFVEGKNVAIEYRFVEDYTRMPALASELVRRQVAVIATASTPAALAAKAATTTIPIVFSIGDDPVKFGLVAALNRPAGNATGINMVAIELEAKRMGTLRELVPAARMIAALVNPKNPNAARQSNDLQDAARSAEWQVHILNAENKREIDAAFATLVQQRIGALTVTGDPFFAARRSQIVTLAARYAIPTIYQRREFAEAGGLISYGTDFREMIRQSGTYVGRILKGEKPAELPVLQPTKYELVINLKAAKTLDLQIPDKLLALADEVIE